MASGQRSSPAAPRSRCGSVRCEAIATSAVKLDRFVPPDELPMEPLVAEAVLEFGEDLREAAASAAERGAVESCLSRRGCADYPYAARVMR